MVVYAVQKFPVFPQRSINLLKKNAFIAHVTFTKHWNTNTFKTFDNFDFLIRPLIKPFAISFEWFRLLPSLPRSLRCVSPHKLFSFLLSLQSALSRFLRVCCARPQNMCAPRASALCSPRRQFTPCLYMCACVCARVSCAIGQALAPCALKDIASDKKHWKT